MNKTLYAENAIILEACGTSTPEKEYPTVTAKPASETPPTKPPGFLEIRAVRPQDVAKATCDWLVMPCQGHAAKGAKARNPFERWLIKLRGLALLRDGWDSYTAP